MKTTHYNVSKSNFFGKSLFAVTLALIFLPFWVHGEILCIKGDSVHARTGPGTTYSIKWEYGDGFPVEVVERKENWVKVRDFEGDTGWVYKSLLINSPQTIVKANKNKEKKINIRSGPGSTNKIIGMAYYGVVFKVLRLQSGWVEVEHSSGLTGWISSNLLWGY